jgi:hypothetical protein
VCAHRFEECVAVVECLGLPVDAIEVERFELRAPLGVRRSCEISAVEAQHIEHDIGDNDSAAARVEEVAPQRPWPERNTAGLELLDGRARIRRSDRVGGE